MTDDALIPKKMVELVRASDVPNALDLIRPTWQAKNLISRVRRLLDVDPSSACQRLLNAAIHDLREKIVIAGMDIAIEAAKQGKLPPLVKPEDIENYSSSNTINLAYQMGLLSRPNWRRISRCYEIRRDLEHEDDEYEAGPEDCLYIFKTCIEVVLAVDPVHLIRVTDVKNLVEQASSVVPAESFIQDFAHAPQPRQEEILKFLISVALKPEHSEIIQQNSFTVLSKLAPHIHSQVRVALATYFQDRIGRSPLDKRHVRVAIAANVFPYLRRVQIADFYNEAFIRLEKVGTDWDAFRAHGDLLHTFRDEGGLLHCPPELLPQFLKWLTLTYIGTPGGRTSYGHVRHVFFSNSAAPIIALLISDAKSRVAEDLRALKADRDVSRLCQNQHIARRFEELLDLVEQ